MNKNIDRYKDSKLQTDDLLTFNFTISCNVQQSNQIRILNIMLDL